MDSNADARRELAIKRLKAKHDFKIHLGIYLAVNALLILIWVVTGWGQPLPQGFFWPIFVIVGWGIGLGSHWYGVYHVPSGFTEEQIEREMRNLP